MSWSNVVRSSAALAALAIVGTGAGLSATASAETIVVRSSGPSMNAYPPGKALPDSARIMLKPNDQVVILDGRGTRTLKGPGTFSPVIASAKPAADLRATFADASTRRARPGAVRGVPTGVASAPKSPNIWFVDMSRSSNACITDAARVTVWRPDRAAEATVTVAGPDGAKGEIKFASGESAQMWPASLPVKTGVPYRLSGGGLTEPTTVTFAILGPNPTGLEGMAAALIKNRCEAQLDLLIETVAIPDVARPAG